MSLEAVCTITDEATGHLMRGVQEEAASAIDKQMARRSG
jgi:hypothetical protein